MSDKQPKLSVKGFRPLPGKVVVELLDRATERGGIILPTTAQIPATQGVVRYIFEEAEVDGQDITPIVKVGDYVLFGQFAGSSITLDGERNKKLVVLREVDLLTIIDYEEPPTILPAEPAGDVDDVVGAAPFTD